MDVDDAADFVQLCPTRVPSLIEAKSSRRLLQPSVQNVEGRRATDELET